MNYLKISKSLLSFTKIVKYFRDVSCPSASDWSLQETWISMRFNTFGYEKYAQEFYFYFSGYLVGCLL